MVSNINSISDRSRMRAFFEFLRRLICVPKCVSCGERLYPFTRDLGHDIIFPCFCGTCMASWQKAKAHLCPKCGMTAAKCTCIPPKYNIKQATVPSLFFYDPSKITPQSRAIFTIKHKRHADLYSFLAQELSNELSAFLKKENISAGDCIFTYIPRTLQGIYINGFDQGRLLSETLCHAAGGRECIPLLCRRGGKQQKKLSKSERKKNAERSFLINSSMRGIRGNQASLYDILHDRTVILVDDVMTTGASLARGAELIENAGAKNVIVCSIARCKLTKKTKDTSR